MSRSGVISWRWVRMKLAMPAKRGVTAASTGWKRGSFFIRVTRSRIAGGEVHDGTIAHHTGKARQGAAHQQRPIGQNRQHAWQPGRRYLGFQCRRFARVYGDGALPRLLVEALSSGG